MTAPRGASDAAHPRRPLERVLRAVAVGTLLVCLWLSLSDATGTASVAHALRGDTAFWSEPSGARVRDSLRARLMHLSSEETVGLSMALPGVPAQSARALLGAWPAASRPIRWHDATGARGLALSVTPVPGPVGGLDVRAAVTDTGAVVLRDGGGVLDSLQGAGRVAWRLASATGTVRVQRGASTARVPVPMRVAARRVRLIAAPGWEAKFVTAALEEQGWTVDGALRITRTASVTLGAPQRLDTAGYAVVVMLDSAALDGTAIDGAGIARFVRQGGGVVLAGDALRAPTVAAIRPARATEVRRGIAGALLTDRPRGGLDAWEVVLDPSAVVLEQEASDHGHTEPLVMARRVDAGRVVASVYRQTWRWRMEGSDEGLAAHRRWWHALVSAAAGVSVAPTGAVASYPGDAAPYADLVARIGSPLAELRNRAQARGDSAELPARPMSLGPSLRDRLAGWRELLFIIAAIALLGEWASRRLRGAL